MVCWQLENADKSMSTGSTGNYELSARNAADDRLRSALHALSGWLERHAWPVLGLMVALYACIF
jgi:hypothetical protein